MFSFTWGYRWLSCLASPRIRSNAFMMAARSLWNTEEDWSQNQTQSINFSFSQHWHWREILSRAVFKVCSGSCRNLSSHWFLTGRKTSHYLGFLYALSFLLVLFWVLLQKGSSEACSELLWSGISETRKTSSSLGDSLSKVCENCVSWVTGVLPGEAWGRSCWINTKWWGQVCWPTLQVCDIRTGFEGRGRSRVTRRKGETGKLLCSNSQQKICLKINLFLFWEGILRKSFMFSPLQHPKGMLRDLLNILACPSCDLKARDTNYQPRSEPVSTFWVAKKGTQTQQSLGLPIFLGLSVLLYRSSSSCWLREPEAKFQNSPRASSIATPNTKPCWHLVQPQATSPGWCQSLALLVRAKTLQHTVYAAKCTVGSIQTIHEFDKRDYLNP